MLLLRTVLHTRSNAQHNCLYCLHWTSYAGFRLMLEHHDTAAVPEQNTSGLLC